MVFTRNNDRVRAGAESARHGDRDRRAASAITNNTHNLGGHRDVTSTADAAAYRGRDRDVTGTADAAAYRGRDRDVTSTADAAAYRGRDRDVTSTADAAAYRGRDRDVTGTTDAAACRGRDRDITGTTDAAAFRHSGLTEESLEGIISLDDAGLNTRRSRSLRYCRIAYV
jgi:hypothetical protein